MSGMKGGGFIVTGFNAIGILNTQSDLKLPHFILPM